MKEVQQKAWSLNLGYTTFTRINLHNIKTENTQTNKQKQDMQKKNKNQW